MYNVSPPPPPPPPPLNFSWGEESWGHCTGSGDIVCTGEECGQTLTTNPLQPLPQDQRETGRNQQHTHAGCQVSTAPCSRGLACFTYCPRNVVASAKGSHWYAYILLHSILSQTSQLLRDWGANCFMLIDWRRGLAAIPLLAGMVWTL